MLPEDYNSGALKWTPEGEDLFSFDVSVEGNVHEVKGSSSVNTSTDKRECWVAVYSGSWPDDVVGGVAVRCVQSIGSIKGADLQLEALAGSEGFLEFVGDVFVEGVAVSWSVSRGGASWEEWYSIGEGVVGDGFYRLPIKTLTRGESSDGVGVVHTITVEVRVGGVVGSGSVSQKTVAQVLTYGVCATECGWYVVSGGVRERVGSGVSYTLPLVYGDGWSVAGRTVSWEVELSGLKVDVGGGRWVAYEDVFNSLRVESGGWDVSWSGAGVGRGIIEFGGCRVVGDADSGFGVVWDVATLWGLSTDMFVGGHATGSCVIGGVKSGSGDSVVLGSLGWSSVAGGGVSGVECYWDGNYSTESGVGYEVLCDAGSLTAGCVVLDGLLTCVPVSLGLRRSGSRVWSTGAVEDLSGDLLPSAFTVETNMRDSFEYRVYQNTTGVWYCDCAGDGSIQEYVGDVVYRGEWGLTFKVGGVAVIEDVCVLKKGCGLSGLLHVGGKEGSDTVGYESSMWISVPDWNLEKAENSGVRVRVGGYWFPADGGYVSVLDGESRSWDFPCYRYNLRSIEEQLIGLYDGGLLSGGYRGGRITEPGFIMPRGFVGGRMDVTYNYIGRGSAIMSVDCGGKLTTNMSVSGLQDAASSWVGVAGSPTVSWG